MATTHVGSADDVVRESHASFPALDGYRAIAVFLVLTTHVAFTTAQVVVPPFGPVLSRFDFGVTLFFLLSGFLLYRPWARAALTDGAGPAVGPYLWRRGLRILPAYWILVVVVFLLLEPTREAGVSGWVANMLLVHTYLPGYAVLGLTQTWSLVTEIAFYLLLPVLAWLLGRRHRGDPDRSLRWQATLLIGCLVVAVGFNWLRTAGPLSAVPGTYSWLPGYLDWFAAGMLLAVLEVRLRMPNPTRGVRTIRQLAGDVPTCLTAGLLVFLVACTPVGGSYTLAGSEPVGVILKHSLYLVAAFLLLLPGTLVPRGTGRWMTFLESPPMAYLGRISYGMFLWHLLVMELSSRALGIGLFQGGFLILWPVTVLGTVLVASASWYLVEAPALRWKRRVPRVLRQRRRAQLSGSG